MTHRELEDDEYTVGVSEANPYDQLRTVFLFIPGDLPFFHKKVGTKKFNLAGVTKYITMVRNGGHQYGNPKNIPILSLNLKFFIAKVFVAEHGAHRHFFLRSNKQTEIAACPSPKWLGFTWKIIS